MRPFNGIQKERQADATGSAALLLCPWTGKPQFYLGSVTANTESPLVRMARPPLVRPMKVVTL